jgi:hypothetical protein
VWLPATSRLSAVLSLLSNSFTSSFLQTSGGWQSCCYVLTTSALAVLMVKYWAVLGVHLRGLEQVPSGPGHTQNSNSYR